MPSLLKNAYLLYAVAPLILVIIVSLTVLPTMKKVNSTLASSPALSLQIEGLSQR
jgi:hypothetical protein